MSNVSSENYFYILLQQRSGALNQAAAQRIAGAVSLALDGVLAERTSQAIFTLVPASAIPPSAKFYHHIKPNHAEFSLPLLLRRLRILLSLSGSDEALHYLQSYFSATKVLAGPARSSRIAHLLPIELSALFAQA